MRQQFFACLSQELDCAALRIDFLFQFVILVVDSTDRERLHITKDELYKMLQHEVSPA